MQKVTKKNKNVKNLKISVGVFSLTYLYCPFRKVKSHFCINRFTVKFAKNQENRFCRIYQGTLVSGLNLRGSGRRRFTGGRFCSIAAIALSAAGNTR